MSDFACFCLYLAAESRILLVRFLHLQRLSETNDGVLCSTVNWRDGDAVEASYGRHVHDNPAVATLVSAHSVQSQERRVNDTFLSADKRNQSFRIIKFRTFQLP